MEVKNQRKIPLNNYVFHIFLVFLLLALSMFFVCLNGTAGKYQFRFKEKITKEDSTVSVINLSKDLPTE